MPPELTVRAMAEFLALPGYKQFEALQAQKYPDQSPAIARIPFYQPALTGIREYYSQDHDLRLVRDRIAELTTHSSLAGISPQKKAKLLNNAGALRAFQTSRFRARDVLLRPKHTFKATVHGVNIKFTPDLILLENEDPKYILLNCRSSAIESELARRTVELSHWVLGQNDENIPPAHVEFVDLGADFSHSFPRIRQATIRHAIQNTQVVKALWGSI